jgi:hypothetical protein
MDSYFLFDWHWHLTFNVITHPLANEAGL